MGIREDIEEVQNDIKEVSFAYSILEDYKAQNRRLFIIIILILIMWCGTIGYLVYVLNDIGTEEITETTYDTNTQEIDNDGSIDNSYIINGDYNGEN